MRLFSSRSTSRPVVLVFIYSAILSFCLLSAWQLRFDFAVPQTSRHAIWFSIIWIVPMKLFILATTRQYSVLSSFFSIRDLIRLYVAITSSSAVVLVLWWGIDSSSSFIPPRGVILIDYISSLMGIASLRLILRVYREKERSIGSRKQSKLKQVGIVGAGHSGANLAKDVFTRKGLGIELKYFFDDNPEKHKSTIHGIPILGKPEILLEPAFEDSLDKLIIALPTTSGRRIKEVVNIANRVGLTCEIVPSMEELTTGRVSVSKLRKVQIQDLLRRDPVQLKTEKIHKLIQDKVVMVTGAGGSIGSELCRQIAYCNPSHLLLIDQCEVQMFTIYQELSGPGYDSIMVPIISDILDKCRMESVFERYKPSLVFHAAAHKHVSLMEQQPAEAFRNNTQGTIAVVNMALRNAVEYFLLVSTDKAINPTNVMGATKRMAEIYIESVSKDKNTQMKLMAVRFGNVLGSSGSVVPIFEKQIDEGGPVTVTHSEVTRFFMTIPEAVGLILQAASQAKGGEIFVLDMGNPIKIIDLAHQLIEMHGHKPGTDIEIEFIGLKPGEKLYEEISHSREKLKETEHKKILQLDSRAVNSTKFLTQIQEIEENLHNMEVDQIKLKLKMIVPEYTPFLN